MLLLDRRREPRGVDLAWSRCRHPRRLLIGLDHQVVGIAVPALAEFGAAHAEDRDLVPDALGHRQTSFASPVGAAFQKYGEAALRIDFLDAEHHAHGHADLDLADIDIGEVDHHAAALVELHHAVMRRRIGRIGEIVGGVGHDPAAELGERLIDLRVATALQFGLTQMLLCGNCTVPQRSHLPPISAVSMSGCGTASTAASACRPRRACRARS